MIRIGDRVRVVSLPDLGEWEAEGVKIIIGMKATVRECGDDCAANNSAGVEFDDYMGGHDGDWKGKGGHCWYLEPECLEKIEETEEEAEEMKKEVSEETKGKMFDQKILETLRKEIGVEIGEEFYLKYEESESQSTCKFEGNGFSLKYGDVFHESEVWKDIVGNFHRYTFKRKPFVPKHGEDYFFLSIGHDKNKNISFNWARSVWSDDNIDYGRLALGNVFRSEEEALANKDKFVKKLEKLRKGE